MAMVQALWTMATEEQDLNSFDGEAMRWAMMARQRGVSDENITRYIDFLKNARSSQAAFQWLPTFFIMYFGVRSQSHIPFWFYPDNLMSEEAIKHERAKHSTEVRMAMYTPVKMHLTTTDNLQRSTSGWLVGGYLRKRNG